MSESATTNTQGAERESRTFIEEIIDQELVSKQDKVCTRFPPEPNGYLHIGHAKAICVDFVMAKKYGGRCHLRMDDTNPAKEDMEYVSAICEDIKWLGFEWDELFFASDYYDKLFEFAVILIKKGKAYVDDSTPDEIRRMRGTLTQPGTLSPFAERSVEENLKLFDDMKNGLIPDGQKVLRARIDMASPNINMRDPIIYRVLRATHYRTGDKWCIYPMYDFAHPLSDAVEGITHSICTLEFEDHRPLYDWFIREVGLWELPPRQIEFARLGIERTIMSKRYLKKLVDEKLVDGWDDPRMPTICGMRRRGYTPESIIKFCDLIGVAKANSTVETALLEHCVRDDLNEKAPRMMVATDPVKLVITNYPEGSFEEIVMENMPSNPELGESRMRFGRTVYIEREDFSLAPPPKFFRLKPGGEVRLKGAYIIKYEDVVTDDDGNILEVHCTYDPDTKSGQCERKVKGTIHWVSADDAIPVELRLYDYLLEETTEQNATLDFSERMNPQSIKVTRGFAEPALADAKPGDKYQFVRIGYFCADKHSTPENLIFNRIVGLKDSYKKR